jgi:hypothetical protein
VHEVIIHKFPLEDADLKEELKTVRKKSLAVLNSMTIQNAPPEKLIELRAIFDDKLDQLAEILS